MTHVHDWQRHVNEALTNTCSLLDERFKKAAAKDWDAARKNRIITGRNRAMKEISAMLDMEYHELPLHKNEDAA